MDGISALSESDASLRRRIDAIANPFCAWFVMGELAKALTGATEKGRENDGSKSLTSVAKA